MIYKYVGRSVIIGSNQKSKFLRVFYVFLDLVIFNFRCLCRPFRRQMTGLVLNVSFWPELEHKMAFVYARKDDVAVASF